MLRKEEKGRRKKKGNSRAFYQEDLAGKVTSNSSCNGTLIQEKSLGIWVIVLREKGKKKYRFIHIIQVTNTLLATTSEQKTPHFAKGLMFKGH